MKPPPFSSPFEVQLLAATEQPNRLVYLALHNDYSEDFSPDTDLDEAQCGDIAVKRLLAGNRGHYGCLEHPSMTLMVRADHNTIMQLRTHRLTSHDVQSMRYTGKRIEEVANMKRPVEDVFYCRPPGQYRDRQGDPYTWTQDDVDEYTATCLSSAIDYCRLRDRGVSEEQARGVLVTSYYQNDVITANLRSWLHLLDLRLKVDAQLEMRVLMEMVAAQLQRWSPEVHSWWAANRKGKAILAP